MRNRLFKAPSPAMTVALLALFLVLGGTSYAAGNSLLAARNSATLPSGTSESGIFGAGDGNSSGLGYIGIGITYPQPLAKAIPTAHVIDVHGKSGAHCPGAGHAARGYLCLYNRDFSGLGAKAVYSNDGQYFPASGGKVGVLLYWQVDTGAAYVGGEWTVTAP